MSKREEEQGLTRWGRQVSDDLDIDHLLASLSPEEVQELENELTMMDPDPSVPVGLRQCNQMEKTPLTIYNHGAVMDFCERETKKLIDQELSSEGEASKEELDEDRCVRKDKEKSQSKKDSHNEVVGKSKEKKGESQRYLSKLQEKCEREGSNEKKVQIKKIHNGKAGEQVSKLNESPDKSRENNLKCKDMRSMEYSQRKEETRLQKKVKNEKKDKGKVVGEFQKLTEHEDTGDMVADKRTGGEAAEGEAEDEETTTKKFEELIEKIRNDDPETTELNVNNSSAIKPKTLVELVEALQENKHVKTLALANTGADDHVACALADILTINKTLNSINLDSNHLTGKGIIALINALQHNATLTALCFHNQRHICGGKTEMEMAKVLKENTTLLKLGYHFQLPGPRIAVTSILSANMDRQRQKRLKDQKQAQACVQSKVPEGKQKTEGSTQTDYAKTLSQPSAQYSKPLSPMITHRKNRGAEDRARVADSESPPQPPPAPVLNVDLLQNSLKPASERKVDDQTRYGGERNPRDQLLASIRNSSLCQLRKVKVPNQLR
ncbi:leiomodin-1-like [Arapaima gigas]